MSILDSFLKKIGVSSFSELTSEEKETFREWEIALQGRQINEKDYRDFLENELNVAIARLTDVDLPKEDEIFRKVEVRFIKKVINFLDMPAFEKKLIEKQIESKI